jgi:hypothetical protein
MSLSTRQFVLLMVLFLGFAGATVLAYFLHWDTALYKRTQDALVVAIGSFGWALSVRSILQRGFSFSNALALITCTIILTMHMLRALHGDLLC